MVNNYLLITGVLFLSYILGSIPFGLLLVKISTGKDIRQIESGRTGGTNAARAAGLWAGVVTALLDGLKAAVTVWIARWAVQGNVWVEVIAPILAIIGHNYSIFLMERQSDGRFRLRGGAGGAPCVGGATGLWFPSLFIILPISMLILYFVGYASLTTMSVAILAVIIFSITAYFGISPWLFVLYGVIAEVLLIMALRPNIKRLLQGNERLVGRRAKNQPQ